CCRGNLRRARLRRDLYSRLFDLWARRLWKVNDDGQRHLVVPGGASTFANLETIWHKRPIPVHVVYPDQFIAMAPGQFQYLLRWPARHLGWWFGRWCRSPLDRPI